MGVFALTQRFFHAEVRKLLLIIGLAVPFIILFQRFSFSYGKIFVSSPTSNSAIVKLVSNATTLNDLNMAELFINVAANDTNGSDPEEEARYKNTLEANTDSDSASEVNRYLDGSFSKFKDQNSHELKSKPRITQGKNFMSGYIPSTDDGSTKVMVKIAKNSEKMINGPKPTTDYGGVVPFISAIVAAKGLQNSNLSSATSSSFLGANLSSPLNAETSIGTQHTNFKPLQIESAISVSQMNSLLLQSIDSSRSPVRITSPRS